MPSILLQSLLQQTTPTTWCCHPRASRLLWRSSACEPPPFSSKHNIGHCSQTVIFLFHQTRGHFSKKYDLCPHMQLQTVVCLFLMRFWSGGFFLAEQPFRLCRYRTRFTCFLQHLHKVICCCSGIDLHFSPQSMFNSKRQKASPSWAVWRLRGPMVFILEYYCLYRWMWYLQAFGNCSQGWTRLVEVYKKKSEV